MILRSTYSVVFVVTTVEIARDRPTKGSYEYISLLITNSFRIHMYMYFAYGQQYYSVITLIKLVEITMIL